MFALIKLNLKRILTRRTLLLLLVLLSVCALLLFFVLDKTREHSTKNPLFEPVTIALCSDESDSAYFKILEQTINQTTYIKQTQIMDRDEAIRQTHTQQIFGALYFPPGFFDQAMSGSYEQPIEIYLSSDASLEASFLQYLAADFSQAIGRTQALSFSYYDWLRQQGTEQTEALEQLNDVARVIVASLINSYQWISHSDHLLLDTLRFLILTLVLIIGFLISLIVGQVMQQDRLDARVERLSGMNGAYCRNLAAHCCSGLLLFLCFLLPIAYLTRGWLPPLIFIGTNLCLAGVWLLQQQLCLQLMRSPVQAAITHIMIFVLMLLLGGQIYPLIMFPSSFAFVRFVSFSYYAARLILDLAWAALPVIPGAAILLALGCYLTRHGLKGARL